MLSSQVGTSHQGFSLLRRLFFSLFVAGWEPGAACSCSKASLRFWNAALRVGPTRSKWENEDGSSLVLGGIADVHMLQVQYGTMLF